LLAFWREFLTRTLTVGRAGLVRLGGRLRLIVVENARDEVFDLARCYSDAPTRSIALSILVGAYSKNGYGTEGGNRFRCIIDPRHHSRRVCFIDRIICDN
jgi:hypothetical protein